MDEKNEQEKSSWFKRNLNFLVPVTIVWVIYYFGPSLFPDLNQSAYSLADDIKQSAHEYNLSLPEMLSNEMRLDSTNTSGLTWNFYNTFVDVQRSDVEGIEEFIIELYRSELGNNPCEFWRSSDAMHSVALNYIYFSNDGYEIGNLTYKYNDCE